MTQTRKRPHEAGVDLRLAAGDRAEKYSETEQGARPVLSLVHHDREPRFESGWCTMHGDTPTGQPGQVYAFLRPYSEDWYDFIPCQSWWEATAVAINLAERTPDCEFVGELGKHCEVAR